MTLPTIETLLKGRAPHTVPEAEAKSLVYTAIATDLFEGLNYLRSRQEAATRSLVPLEECLHCTVADIATRKQVIRLAAYDPLRAYVEEKLGLLIALHNFRPKSDDGGPSARIVIAPAQRVFGSTQVRSNLPTSPAKSWQVMSWGKTAEPPALLPEAEAEAHIWAYVNEHHAEALAILAAAPQDGASYAQNGRLIPSMLTLLGVPGIRQVVEAELGGAFTIYNCCAPAREEKKEEKERPEITFSEQLRHQAHAEMMDC